MRYFYSSAINSFTKFYFYFASNIIYLSNFDTWYSRFECDKETIRLVDVPSGPRSYNSIELFSDKVYNMCRVLSMIISIIAEGSVIA